MLRIKSHLILIPGIIVFAACSTTEAGKDYKLRVPSSFDSLPHVPDDNRLTRARIDLGRNLFFDPALSADGIISCGSCHKPDLAYADTVAVSAGVHGNLDFRNSPSLVNVAYRKTLFREGGVPSLELQMLAPLGNENEMGLNLQDAVAAMNRKKAYRILADKGYGEPLTPLVMARALASFQRSLVSSGSRYDAFLEGDINALSSREKRGMELFYSEETACGSCHSGFLLADGQFHNIGLYETYSDRGRARLTMNPDDIGKMSTPSLRNVAVTYPYMHDGSMATLDEVLRHYNAGGNMHSNKDLRVRPLELSADQLTDMKSFLQSLTDTVYTTASISHAKAL